MERIKINPIIPGFAPDPSIVYVNGTYFLVNSSFHLFPGLPVYASKDLKEWRQIGNALDRARHMAFRDSHTKIEVAENVDETVSAQGGLYAPTIRYHNGTVYIVCTNVLHKKSLPPGVCEYQNFILSTTDIWADEWNDPVFYDFNGIDTSLFWDDDGRVYVVGAGSAPCNTAATVIKQFEIDLKTGAKLSEEKVLWEGVTKVYPEGPHMYKKDGWYYLLIAEGGCYADHHTIMARSREIWGPFDVNPANPVLPKADPNGYVQFTGHGDLFQDTSGQWFFVCLGARKNGRRFIMGRESFLTTATWPEGEFPVIDTVRLDVSLPVQKATNTIWPDRRKSGRINVGYVRVRDVNEESYHYDDTSITLTSSKADLSQVAKPVTFTGKRQRYLDGSASATLEPLAVSSRDGSRLKTGLCYYKDEHRFISLHLDVEASEVVLEVINKARCIERRVTRSVGTLNIGHRTIFGVDYTEKALVFWYLVEGDKKVVFEPINTLDLTGQDFVGPIIGIYAVSDRQCKVQYSGIVLEDF
ncbi:beta-xylosidase [Pyrenochaeta sp. DS3sAY3a]|nr:beta-xylosidase [Pyrenochaeta sp. DS3sAY3a]